MRVKVPEAPYIIKGRGQHKLAYIICPSPQTAQLRSTNTVRHQAIEWRIVP